MIESLENVSFKYDLNPILDHVSLVVNEKDKWGIVGQNGAGKSTLLKILAGEEKPDEGEVIISNKYKISYCPQNIDFTPGRSVYDTVLSYMKEKTEDYEIKAILNKLGIAEYDQPVEMLSGGQKKRTALAIALIRKADLYLLDEPTNHLDQDMIVWLEKFLIRTNAAVVMVTHDRYFLSRITNHMVDVDHAHLYLYDGNYADYLEQREIRREQAAASEQKRQNFLRNEIQWIRAGAQARSTKQKSRIQRFEKIAAMEAPEAHKTLQLESAATRLGRNTIEIRNISKSYGDKHLFSNFSYSVQRMDRIGIIGPNGCGKTTLLKVIMGQIKPDTGSIEIGETVKIGYFAQQNEVFKKDMRVIDYLENFGKVVYTADHEPITASQMLERFLFFKEDKYKPISKCSGGEQRRLYLCSVLMTAPNILILDEPTNDLDTDTMTILEDYLDQFHGAVIAVSHDRYFLDKTADRLLVFENGKISVVQMTYSDYLDQHAKEETKTETVRKPRVKEKNTRRLSYQEKRELAQLNEQVPVLEEDVKNLEKALEGVTDFSEITRISKELDEKRIEMEIAENRWLELSEKEE